MNIPAWRRRPAVPVLLLSLALVTAGCADNPTAGPSPTPPPLQSSSGPTSTTLPKPSGQTSTPTTSTKPTTPGSNCIRKVISAMSLREQAAQLVMSGVRATGVRSSERSTLRAEQPGGVLLMGAGGSVAEVRDVVHDAVGAVGREYGVQPLVAADQEGGKVQRLRGSGFERIPSAREQGTWTSARLTAKAAAWARELAGVGVNVDLAPVADVVPASVGDRNEPIGALDRNFGSTPDTVSGPVAAFVRGMSSAGVMTSVKHFPGLGRVRGNTDFSAGVVDGVTTRNDPLLKPFAAGIAAGTDMVMIATATYTRIDPQQRAVFSPIVIRDLLRGDLGYGGVVISDDLGVAAEVKAVPVGQRATRFVAAGGDIVITADAGLVRPMVDALVAKADADPVFARQLGQSVQRVLALKERRDLVKCDQ
ncbi:glycoside hydrolase family 3 N-terminal domain-containing protein [Kribbella deserti]|uniref:beta-N-acetylhexosaminidase n=1 Tax=Kribbella deserti TaxID=1926257 RepID=A0ABV6QX08_9ACTN